MMSGPLGSRRAKGRSFASNVASVLAMFAGMLLGLSTTDAAAPQKISYITALLSDSDVAAIKTALIAEWHGGSGPEFAKIIASADPAGTISVCGFERGKVISGNNTGMQPFIGVLSRLLWRFTVTASNNDGSMAANVLRSCREHALYLIPE